jgi:hypothetical protein
LLVENDGGHAMQAEEKGGEGHDRAWSFEGLAVACGLEKKRLESGCINALRDNFSL